MDPVADKLLVTAALVSLVQMDVAPAWMVAVILGREFAVTVLRAVAWARGIVISASPLGKFKMAAQVTAILALILGARAPAKLLRHREDRALGGGHHRCGLRHRLLPAIQRRPLQPITPNLQTPNSKRTLSRSILNPFGV